MAVTPEYVLSQSPNAVLTPEEAKDAAELEAVLDSQLLGVPTGPVDPAKKLGWSGGLFYVDLGGVLSPRVVGVIVRRYREAGWLPRFEPLHSQTRGPRGEVVVAGLRLTLEPMWERAASRDEPEAEIVEVSRSPIPGATAIAVPAVVRRERSAIDIRAEIQREAPCPGCEGKVGQLDDHCPACLAEWRALHPGMEFVPGLIDLADVRKYVEHTDPDLARYAHGSRVSP